jgi:Bacteriophage lambda head decoration protein D
MAWQPQVIRIERSVGTVGGDIEFLASEHYTVKRVGITLDSTLWTADGNGDKIVPKGSVLGRVTATGRYGPYNNAAGDGREVAKGFLIEGTNLKFGNQVTGLVIAGSVIAARCSGLDAAGIVDLPTFVFQ